MSFIKIKHGGWIAIMAMLALPGALMTSCSKEDPTENVAPKGDKLVISVLGINDGNNSDKSGKKASNTRASFAGLSEANAHKVYEFSDVDMAVSIDNALPVKKSKQSINARFPSGLANSGLKAAEEMASGIKYVIYVYDGTTLVASKELDAGTAGTIDGLDMDAEYTWVALSYNSDENVPTPTPTTNVIANLPENTDVLYARGTVDLATDPNIGIVFDHAFSRIGVELNTIGAFGEITGATSVAVTGANLATGDIDLLTGVVTAGDTYVPELTMDDFENVDPEYNDVKIAYLYTAATDQQNLTVSIQGLTLNHVDQVGGTVTRTYFASGSDFQANVTPELGNSHHIQLNVVESALTTNYDGNEVKWARSNLYYRGDNGGDRNYAFYANNELTSRADGYFGFGGTVAGTFATNETEGDPCALVYPVGIWRQPEKADFAGLVRGDIELDELTSVLGPLGEVVDASGVTGLLNIITSLLGNTVATLVNSPAPHSSLSGSPYTYGQYEISAGAPSSGTNAFGDANSSSNNLRFYYNGQISDLTVLEELGNGGGLLGLGLNDLSIDLLDQNVINLGVPLLDSHGDLTALWTGEQGTDILGLVGAGTWGYLGNAGRGFEWSGILPTLNARFHMANNTGELLNGVSALGIDVLSTTLKNVRCVRN